MSEVSCQECTESIPEARMSVAPAAGFVIALRSGHRYLANHLTVMEQEVDGELMVCWYFQGLQHNVVESAVSGIDLATSIGDKYPIICPYCGRVGDGLVCGPVAATCKGSKCNA